MRPTASHRHRSAIDCAHDSIRFERSIVRRSPSLATAARHTAKSDRVVLGSWSGRSDSNARPPEPHSGALPGCATPRRSEVYQTREQPRSRGACRRPRNVGAVAQRSTGLPAEMLGESQEQIHRSDPWSPAPTRASLGAARALAVGRLRGGGTDPRPVGPGCSRPRGAAPRSSPTVAL